MRTSIPFRGFDSQKVVNLMTSTRDDRPSKSWGGFVKADPFSHVLLPESCGRSKNLKTPRAAYQQDDLLFALFAVVFALFGARMD